MSQLAARVDRFLNVPGGSLEIIYKEKGGVWSLPVSVDKKMLAVYVRELYMRDWIFRFRVKGSTQVTTNEIVMSQAFSS